MENKYWRITGYSFIILVFFLVGYSFGFAKGGEKTFEFFITFIDYSVDNGILKMEIDSEKLEDYLMLAKEYCYRSQGSGSLSFGKINCLD